MSKAMTLTWENWDDLNFTRAPPKLSLLLDVATLHYKVPKRHIQLSYFNLQTFKFFEIDLEADYKDSLAEKGRTIVIAVTLPDQIAKFIVPNIYQEEYQRFMNDKANREANKSKSDSPQKSKLTSNAESRASIASSMQKSDKPVKDVKLNETLRESAVDMQFNTSLENSLLDTSYVLTSPPLLTETSPRGPVFRDKSQDLIAFAPWPAIIANPPKRRDFEPQAEDEEPEIPTEPAQLLDLAISHIPETVKSVGPWSLSYSSKIPTPEDKEPATPLTELNFKASTEKIETQVNEHKSETPTTKSYKDVPDKSAYLDLEKLTESVKSYGRDSESQHQAEETEETKPPPKFRGLSSTFGAAIIKKVIEDQSVIPEAEKPAERLKRDSKDLSLIAWDSLQLLSVLEMEQIPLDLTKAIVEVALPDYPTTHVLNNLQAFGIISILGEHVSIRPSKIESLEIRQQVMLGKVLLSKFDFNENMPETLIRTQEYLPFVTRFLSSPKLRHPTEERLNLLLKLGEYRFSTMGKPESAVPYFEEAVNLASILYPELTGNQQLSKAHDWLAKCHIVTSKLAQAEMHIKKSIEIKVQLYGTDHVETAKGFHALGNLHLSLKQVQEAIEWHWKALEIKKKHLGEESEEVSLTIGMLAADYMESQDFEKALDLLHQAKRIRKKIFNPKHQKLSDVYFNISSTHLNMKQFEQAGKYIDKSYEIRQRVYGDDHYLAQVCQVNKAQCLVQADELDEAENLCIKAKKVFDLEFGPDHPYSLAAKAIIRTVEAKRHPQNGQHDQQDRSVESVEPVQEIKRSSCCLLF